MVGLCPSSLPERIDDLWKTSLWDEEDLTLT